MKWRHAQQQINAEDEPCVHETDDKIPASRADTPQSVVITTESESNMNIHEVHLDSMDLPSDEEISVIDMKTEVS